MFKSRSAVCNFCFPFSTLQITVHFWLSFSNKSSNHLHCCSLVCNNTTTTKPLATLAAFKVCFFILVYQQLQYVSRCGFLCIYAAGGFTYFPGCVACWLLYLFIEFVRLLASISSSIFFCPFSLCL